jgi:ATP-dependent helicase/nuclease subunit A
LTAQVRDLLQSLRDRWLQLATQTAAIDGLEAYAEYINELLAAVASWRDAFGDGEFDQLAAEVNSFEMPRLPTIRGGPPEKETIKNGIDAIRKEMTGSSFTKLARFSEAEWRAGLGEIHQPASVIVSLTRDFAERFAAAKRELRGLDFTDLERLALRTLRQDNVGAALLPSPIALAFHQQFKHVLVDEYQDINDVQDAILSLVSTERVAGDAVRSNLFCVGDVKQSIYRFRLAQPVRFLDRYKRFRGGDATGAVIDLSANFRSRAPLLDAINALFERLMTERAMEIEYDAAQRLIPGADYPAANGTPAFSGAPIELHLLAPPPRGDHTDDADESADLDRSEREAALIAHRIKELIASGMHVVEKTPDGLSLRPIQYRDIVILLRSTKYKSAQYADVLRAARIPVHSDSGSGFFESMEIRDMLSLLRVLDNQQQDIPLAAVLRSPLASLPEPEDSLARIRLAYPDTAQTPFHHAVTCYAAEQHDELAAHLEHVLENLSRWRQMANQRPLAEVLWHIYDTTGYLAFCAGMEDGQQRVANLIDFHERARQFGTFQRQGLSRFMRFLDTLAEESDLGQPAVASEADDVVRIMSIHRSKGLEFPVVFVPDLGKKHNIQDASGSILIDRDAGMGLLVADPQLRVRYPSLAHVVVQDRIRRQTLAEEMRILYVAMTRAREHLILIGTCEEASMQGWVSQWSGHRGQLSADRLLGARTMLDWIGPAAAACNGAGQEIVSIVWHGENVPAVHPAPPAAARAEALAQLRPLDPPPPMHPDAQRVMQRLRDDDPLRPYATMPAAVSVGGLTKQGRLAPAGHRPAARDIVPFKTELRLPRCVSEETKPSPTEIGSATHLVLEHLDFARPCDAGDLEAQIAALIDRKLIAPSVAAMVDRLAIAWLMQTELGALLRRNSAALRRELPLFYPMRLPDAPPSNDPLDRVMVRGRLDLLVPDASGLVLVDFKTDHVTSETVDARAEFYRPQIASYREAIERILRRPVAKAILVFLHPRIVREV